MDFVRALAIFMVVLLVILIPVNIVVNMFDNTISLLLPGNKFWELKNEDKNAIYFSMYLIISLRNTQR